ncbi:MAG: AraC family transcriptional regulator [Arenimonas sp.]
MDSNSPDRLDSLLRRFGVTARMFHSGPLCGINDIPIVPGEGHLHVIRSGGLEVRHPKHPVLQITQPTVLFYPRPLSHRFISDVQQGADMVCANLQFSGGALNPVAQALPAVLVMPINQLPNLQATIDLLFAEAFAGKCGSRVAVDRLFDVLLVQLLRHVLENDQHSGGMLAGLSHTQLRRALVAMHEQPAEAWNLEQLAQRAGMSRTAFATGFKNILGMTPGDYLATWRMSLAQDLLLRGKPIKLIANEVGYASALALSRVFKAYVGMTPHEWKKMQTGAE